MFRGSVGYRCAPWAFSRALGGAVAWPAGTCHEHLRVVRYDKVEIVAETRGDNGGIEEVSVAPRTCPRDKGMDVDDAKPAMSLTVMITGAAGMLGRKLAELLAERAAVAGHPLAGLQLVDVIPPVAPSRPVAEVGLHVADLTEPGAAEDLMALRPDVVFHLAATVSGEAEEDLEKGYAVNLDGTRALLDAIRRMGPAAHWRPRFVFASSVGVYGSPYPPVLPDDFHLTPHSSYGTQKAMGELLVNDYARRGFLDGISLRLPTICVRPGTPNRAISGFFSNILREPLVGQPALLPVGEEVRHCFASPRAAVVALAHAALITEEQLAGRTALMMPSVAVSVGEQIAALRAVAGDEAASLIRREPDELVSRIALGWPSDFEAKRARALGFTVDASIEAIVRTHIADELGGRLAAWPDAPINQEVAG